MNGLHPALAFLRDRMRAARPLGSDALLLDVDGVAVEIFVAPAGASRALFAAGRTRLSYRCAAELTDRTRESLRRALLDLVRALSDGLVDDPRRPLPQGGGWTDSLRDGDLPAWRDWVARSYRAVVESGGRDECAGLPDCLDMRMRPPIPSPWADLVEAPRSGPCARCGRAGGCFAARSFDEERNDLKPLRHADSGAAEIAALRVLAAAAGVPIAQALEAYSLLTTAAGDRAVEGALPLEYSVRLPRGQQQPDRLRFVSYYPLVTSDAARERINRGRRAAVRELAARWLTADEAAVLDAWLECARQTQPATLGLSIGVEIDAAGVRLQVYAHPEPNGDALRFAAAAVAALGGSPRAIPQPESPPVLVGIALSANRRPGLKLYYHRVWGERGDTGLLPDGMADLEPFNPGWGLAIQEHVDGGAAWAKWDFPVTTHYQDYERFLAAFWGATGCPRRESPEWLSGDQFSPWPTWASLGRGGWALYFHAR
jgi:hypothetical protein